MTEDSDNRRKLLADRIREIPVEVRAQTLKLVQLRQAQVAASQPMNASESNGIHTLAAARKTCVNTQRAKSTQ